mgnify:CR=1 FL=1
MQHNIKYQKNIYVIYRLALYKCGKLLIYILLNNKINEKLIRSKIIDKQ